MRLNIYAIAPPTVDRVREQLSKRLEPTVRPVITAVLTPMPHRQALVAVDAVALAPATSAASAPAAVVALQRCDAVFGDNECADAAVLPRGGVAYLSGMPAEGGLAVSAISKSMSGPVENTLLSCSSRRRTSCNSRYSCGPQRRLTRPCAN